MVYTVFYFTKPPPALHLTVFILRQWLVIAAFAAVNNSAAKQLIILFDTHNSGVAILQLCQSLVLGYIARHYHV